MASLVCRNIFESLVLFSGDNWSFNSRCTVAGSIAWPTSCASWERTHPHVCCWPGRIHTRAKREDLVDRYPFSTDVSVKPIGWSGCRGRVTRTLQVILTDPSAFTIEQQRRVLGDFRFNPNFSHCVKEHLAVRWTDPSFWTGPRVRCLTLLCVWNRHIKIDAPVKTGDLFNDYDQQIMPL